MDKTIYVIAFFIYSKKLYKDNPKVIWLDKVVASIKAGDIKINDLRIMLSAHEGVETSEFADNLFTLTERASSSQQKSP